MLEKKTKTEVKESTRIFPPHLVICNKAMLQKNTMTDVKESTCIFPTHPPHLFIFPQLEKIMRLTI